MISRLRFRGVCVTVSALVAAGAIPVQAAADPPSGDSSGRAARVQTQSIPEKEQATASEPKVEVGKKALIKGKAIDVEGTISSIADDKIEVLTDDGARSVPRKEITSLSVLVGKKNHALLAGVIGGGVGGILGAVKPKSGMVTTTCYYSYDSFGNVTSEDCSDEGGSNRAVMIAAGTAIGALAGVLVGHMIRTDKWKNVTDQVQVAVLPEMHRGVRIALSVSF